MHPAAKAGIGPVFKVKQAASPIDTCANSYVFNSV
jgi:hypothetical protein